MYFNQFLKQNKDARKIFGRKELEIIIKQLEGISLTQSEKNRLSRDIRAKFEFIRDCEQFKDYFKLKKGQLNKDIIDKAVDIILKDVSAPEIKMILLFGSAVDNTLTYRSDIDICVIFNKQISKKESSQFRIRILGQLPEKADVQVFENLPFKIRREILKKNKILYKAQNFDSTNFTMRWYKIINEFFQLLKKNERTN